MYKIVKIIFLVFALIACADKTENEENIASLTIKQKNSDLNYEIIDSVSLSKTGVPSLDKSASISFNIENETLCGIYVKGDESVVAFFIGDSTYGYSVSAFSGETPENSSNPDCVDNPDASISTIHAFFLTDHGSVPSEPVDVRIYTSKGNYDISIDPENNYFPAAKYHFDSTLNQSYPLIDDEGVFSWEVNKSDESDGKKILIHMSYPFEDRIINNLTIVDFNEIPGFTYSLTKLPSEISVDVYYLN